LSKIAHPLNHFLFEWLSLILEEEEEGGDDDGEGETNEDDDDEDVRTAIMYSCWEIHVSLG